MSEPTSTEPQPPLPPPLPKGGCLSVLMLLAGILLLLPGLCSLVVGGVMIADWQGNKSYMDSSIVGLFAVTFAISAVGILLIRAAIRGPRR
jgi:hypothetical protein